MTEETLEQWAAREVADVTAEDWAGLRSIREIKATWESLMRSCIRKGYAWILNKGRSNMTIGLTDKGGALLAHRDKVARGLSRAMRGLLREAEGNETAWLRRLLGGEMWVTFYALARRGLVVERCQMPFLTDFGREVLRVIQESQ